MTDGGGSFIENMKRFISVGVSCGSVNGRIYCSKKVVVSGGKEKRKKH